MLQGVGSLPFRRSGIAVVAEDVVGRGAVVLDEPEGRFLPALAVLADQQHAQAAALLARLFPLDAPAAVAVDGLVASGLLVPGHGFEAEHLLVVGLGGGGQGRRVLLHGVGDELDALGLLEAEVVDQHLGIAGQLEHLRRRRPGGGLLPELAHEPGPHRLALHQRPQADPVLPRAPAGDGEGVLLQLVGQAQAPGACQGSGAFAGGDVRFHLAAADAAAADAVEEAGLVLVDEQGLPRRALYDLRVGVDGDDHAVGGEEVVGVEGGGPGGDQAAPGHQLHVEAVLPHEPAVLPEAGHGVVAAIVDQRIEDGDAGLAVPHLHLVNRQLLDVSLGLANPDPGGQVIGAGRAVQDQALPPVVVVDELHGSPRRRKIAGWRVSVSGTEALRRHQLLPGPRRSPADRARPGRSRLHQAPGRLLA